MAQMTIMDRPFRPVGECTVMCAPCSFHDLFTERLQEFVVNEEISP